ncbi:MAG: DNA polymerase III subunit chi [Pseudomonadota bacterium]
MTEVWFYHLERARLEGVLPDLLEKTLARGARALVKAGSGERLDALDAHLWTYRDDAFLPHGRAGEPEAGRQPVVLGVGDEAPNAATFLFLVDGATADDVSGFERCITIFDGADDEAVKAARVFWKEVKSKHYQAAYWRQSAEGRWEKQA